MLKFIAILFALFGCYSLYIVFSGQGYLAVIGAAVALVAAVGLWLRKAWSQSLVYLLSAGFVVEWLWLLWRSVQNNLWPYESKLQSVIALIPGLLLVGLVVGVSVVAFRGFRDRS